MPSRALNDRNDGTDLDEVDDFEEDPRWSLLRDLDKRARGRWSDWTPFRVEHLSTALGYWTGKAPPPLGRAVTITFDARMTREELLVRVRGIQRHLREKGVLNKLRNRPLEERKIALLRFVCLEAPGDAWADRYATWNRRPAHQRAGWSYDSEDALRTDCHEAEEKLTGRRHGLAWFYDPLARMTAPELQQRAADGDTDAAREQRIRRNEGWKSLEIGLRLRERADSSPGVRSFDILPKDPAEAEAECEHPPKAIVLDVEKFEEWCMFCRTLLQTYAGKDEILARFPQLKHRWADITEKGEAVRAPTQRKAAPRRRGSISKPKTTGRKRR